MALTVEEFHHALRIGTILKGEPVILIAPSGASDSRYRDSARVVQQWGARLIAIVTPDGKELLGDGTGGILLPGVKETFQPSADPAAAARTQHRFSPAKGRWGLPASEHSTSMSRFASWGIIVDDIVFPDGRTAMGVLGGGGFYAAVGMRLWTPDVQVQAGVGLDFDPRILETSGLDGSGLRSYWITDTARLAAI